MGAQHSGGDAADWDTEAVVAALHGLGPAFACYAQAITDNGLDGEMLLTLTSKDLEALGVDNSFHKRKLLREIEKVNQSRGAEAEEGKEPQKRRQYGCKHPGCQRSFSSLDGLGLHQEWHKSHSNLKVEPSDHNGALESVNTEAEASPAVTSSDSIAAASCSPPIRFACMSRIFDGGRGGIEDHPPLLSEAAASNYKVPAVEAVEDWLVSHLQLDQSTAARYATDLRDVHGLEIPAEVPRLSQGHLQAIGMKEFHQHRLLQWVKNNQNTTLEAMPDSRISRSEEQKESASLKIEVTQAQSERHEPSLKTDMYEEEQVQEGKHRGMGTRQKSSRREMRASFSALHSDSQNSSMNASHMSSSHISSTRAKESVSKWRCNIASIFAAVLFATVIFSNLMQAMLHFVYKVEPLNRRAFALIAGTFGWVRDGFFSVAFYYSFYLLSLVKDGCRLPRWHLFHMFLLLGCWAAFYYPAMLGMMAVEHKYKKMADRICLVCTIWNLCFVLPFPFLVFRKHLNWGRWRILLAYHLVVNGLFWAFVYWWYLKPKFFGDAAKWRELPASTVDAFGILYVVGFISTMLGTLLWDGCNGRSKNDTQFDVLYLAIMFSSNTMMGWCAAFIMSQLLMLSKNQTALFFAFFGWNFAYLFFYLLMREMARRSVPKPLVPLFVLPTQFLGDFFGEILFTDFDITKPQFWCLIVLDTGLLIIRDADLWYDFIEWMKFRLGEQFGATMVALMQILSGHEEGIDRVFRKRGQTSAAKKEQQGNTVDREFLDNAIISEVLCSLTLFVITVIEAIWGFGLITLDQTPKQRRQTALVYFIIFTIECIGLMFSHRIVHWKNRAANEIQVWRHIRDHYKQCSLKPTKAGASDESYKHHFFVSHRQDNGQDQAAVITDSLRQMGFKVWLDMDSSDLTKSGMEDGILQSDVFILFCTKGVLDRPFVQFEVDTAIAGGKSVLLVHEEDHRHGKFDFEVPTKYQPLLDDKESLPWRRRHYERHAFLREVLARAESCSTFGIEYLRHLQRHERAIKSMLSQKRVKSVSEGDQSIYHLDQARDTRTRNWVHRLKVCFIVYIFVACYSTFQIARDGIEEATGWLEDKGA